jgi:heme ABC exporter ATP-binding subunit CcmA
MTIAISLDDVVVLAGGYPVLAQCSAAIARGSMVVVRGPNGAGKTSLLRAIAGLLPIESGAIRLEGHAPRSDSAPRVGYLGHSHGLYDELTAQANLTYLARVQRRDANSVEVALDAARLTGRLARTPVGALSAGQRRRAALAALVLMEPAIWLLDEPHAGLDTDSRAVLEDLLRRAKHEGRTIVLSSHELGVVNDLATGELIMAGGRVIDARDLGGPDVP